MMKKVLLSFCLIFCGLIANAAVGGPDAYGYTWKDSFEGDGPVYNWIDITTTGTLITGLADDNTVGPISLSSNFPFYWYSVKNIWVGSNGYLSFGNDNFSAPFPVIPDAGGGNDFVAAFMADLTFTGAGNPAQCYYYDDPDTAIFSFIDVPFWDAVPPNFVGANTFQIIMSKLDSTLVIQYHTQTGITQANDISIGIENISGTMGLMHSMDTYPQTGYAVRYINPRNPLVTVEDAEALWNTNFANAAEFHIYQGTPFSLKSNYKNAGNQLLFDMETDVFIMDTGFNVLLADNQHITDISLGSDTTIIYGNQFSAALPGTFVFRSILTGLINEFSTLNNSIDFELVVVDTSQFITNLSYTGLVDDGFGLAWNGGNGGIGMHFVPPYYPARIVNTNFKVISNNQSMPFYAKIYDDDGPNGAPGTLLDSVYVGLSQMNLGGNTQVPVSTTLNVASGGIYVLWDMGGPDVTLGRDLNPPFSLRTYEVIDGAWAEYRDRETQDFFISVDIAVPFVDDVGVIDITSPVASSNIQITAPSSVTMWIKNYGGLPDDNFTVHYQFENEPTVTQPYVGQPINPGDSVQFTFASALLHNVVESGQLCAWTERLGDANVNNDTSCVAINFVDNTAILEYEGFGNVSVYPNPTFGTLTFQFKPIKASDVNVEIYNSLGKLIRTEAIGKVSQPMEYGIDVAELSKGIYHYRVVSMHGITSGSFVKH
jgi:hypothetical protein